MDYLKRIWLTPLLILFALSGTAALAANDNEAWAPTPPRLSFIVRRQEAPLCKTVK